uniref:LrgA family protein n=1 Tax=Burkholderia sp. (strain CCGE1003) TaxID=640512 RepID=E1TIL0_BURSG
MTICSRKSTLPKQRMDFDVLGILFQRQLESLSARSLCVFSVTSANICTVSPGVIRLRTVTRRTLSPALAGFVVVVAALSLKLLLGFVKEGARPLIARIALFLIPPVVLFARRSALLETHWLPLLAIIVGGTAVSAATTAIVDEGTSRAVVRRRAE